MLSEICDEFTALARETRYLSSFLSVADSFVLVLALIMLIGVFLPWVSADGLPTQTGLMGGGDVHLLLALFALYQVFRVAQCHVRAFRMNNGLPFLPIRLRRISLFYLLIGGSSIVASVFTLIYCGSQYATIDRAIDVRFGFYLTAFSGICIFFCGLERFCGQKKRI